MFQNSNSLPIALVQSLVSEVPGLKWGKGDTKDQMLGRALTYMVLYSTLGMIVSFLLPLPLISASVVIWREITRQRRRRGASSPSLG